MVAAPVTGRWAGWRAPVNHAFVVAHAPPPHACRSTSHMVSKLTAGARRRYLGAPRAQRLQPTRCRVSSYASSAADGGPSVMTMLPTRRLTRCPKGHHQFGAPMAPKNPALPMRWGSPATLPPLSLSPLSLIRRPATRQVNPHKREGLQHAGFSARGRPARLRRLNLLADTVSPLSPLPEKRGRGRPSEVARLPSPHRCLGFTPSPPAHGDSK